MRLPASVRTGMFWRFGSVELRRPVAVVVCPKVVWIRPSSATDFWSPSTVCLSLIWSRCRRRCARNGCSVFAYSDSNASASVQIGWVRLVLGIQFVEKDHL